MKITIVGGAGCVGSCAAYRLAQDGFASEIVLVDSRRNMAEDQKEQVRKRIASFLSEWNQLQSGRTAGWATAESIGDIVASMASGDGRIWSCSTPLEGEYGLRDVSLGVPVRVGPAGVKEIVEFDLDPGERSGLEASADAIRLQIKRGESLLIESGIALNQLLTSLKKGR